MRRRDTINIRLDEHPFTIDPEEPQKSECRPRSPLTTVISSLTQTRC